MTTFQFPPGVIHQAFEKFQATLSSDLKLVLNGRLERGLSIALAGGVASFDEDTRPEYLQRFKVRSSDLSNPPYTVDLSERSCTCRDHWKGHYCKHRIAANSIKTAITGCQDTASSPSKTCSERNPSPDVLGAIYARQPVLQELIGNGWLQLAAKDPDSPTIMRFVPGSGWVEWRGAATAPPVVKTSAEWMRGRRDNLPPALIAAPAEGLR